VLFSVADRVRKRTVGRELSGRWWRLRVMGPDRIYVENRHGRSSHKYKVRIKYSSFKNL